MASFQHQLVWKASTWVNQYIIYFTNLDFCLKEGVHFYLSKTTWWGAWHHAIPSGASRAQKHGSAAGTGRRWAGYHFSMWKGGRNAQKHRLNVCMYVYIYIYLYICISIHITEYIINICRTLQSWKAFWEIQKLEQIRILTSINNHSYEVATWWPSWRHSHFES